MEEGEEGEQGNQRRARGVLEACEGGLLVVGGWVGVVGRVGGWGLTWA